jgi:hypothetical protein
MNERAVVSVHHVYSEHLDVDIQSDSKLLSGFPWPINGNPDNNLEPICIKCSILRKGGGLRLNICVCYLLEMALNVGPDALLDNV